MIPIEKPGTPQELVHYGVKGMKWGVRKKRDSSGSSRSSSAKTSVKKGARKAGRYADNVLFELSRNSEYVNTTIVRNAGEKLAKDLPGIKARHQKGSKLRTRVLRPTSSEAKAYRSDVKNAYLKRLEESANEITNVSGTRRYTLKENGKPNTSQYYWEVRTEEVKHSDGEVLRVHPVFDGEGYIIRVEMDMAAHGERFTSAYFAYHG